MLISRLSITFAALIITVIIYILIIPIAQESGFHVPHASLNNLIPQHHGATSKPADYEPTWLVFTSSAAHLRQRREIIRSTWQTLYRNASFTPLFVTGNPAPEWLPLLAQENATYGDMLILDGTADDKKFATTLKPFETLKYLRDQAASTGKKWDFVSKIDDDSFLNAVKFRQEILGPNKDTKSTIISRVVQYARPHVFPGGQFYTLTWDLVERLALLYETASKEHLIRLMNGETEKKLAKRHEDFMIADLLVQDGYKFDYIKLDDDRAFDVVAMGNVSDKSINVHRMKKDEEYLWVAAMFDESGFQGLVRDGVDYWEKLTQSINSE